MAQDSPFKLQKVADFGTSEPWLARIELGIPEVAKFTISERAAREAFPEIWHHVGMKLGEAFATLVTIRKLSSDPETTLIQLSKEYNSLYSLLWAAHKDRWQTAMKTIDFDFGFLFVADKNFENSFALFGKEHPTLDLVGLKQLATSERAGWQSQLANHRNDDIEHRKDGSHLEFFRTLARRKPRSATSGVRSKTGQSCP
jgi:hypothetical protein